MNKNMNVVFELVRRDLKKKYRGSMLGVIWSLLNPLLMMIILTIVFSNVFRFDTGNYPLYLITGQVLFGFFSEIFNFNIKTVKYLSNTKVSVTYEVVILDLDKILDEKEIKKRFFKKYGYEIKDDEDFVSLSEVKKRKDIMKEMLREGMRNPKNYVTDKVTDELNKIGNEWKFKDAEKFEEMLKKMK